MVPECLANPVSLFEFEFPRGGRNVVYDRIINEHFVNVRDRLEIKTIDDLVNGLLSVRDRLNERK